MATSTTGFTAGAESRNVSAAAGATPRATSRPAIGTEPHSQPGQGHAGRGRDRHGEDRTGGQRRASAAGGT